MSAKFVKRARACTYTIVGLSSALIVLVSKYGFSNILESGRIILDPSRIAAQIVSGIGFIGGGVIFVRKDIVRGLTTASTVWLTAAVGMACGAGLPVLAIAVTGGHFVVVMLFPAVERRLPKSRWAPSSLRISYQEGRGVLREILAVCTHQEFSVSRVQVEREPLTASAQSGAQADKGLGTGWEDHPAEVVEAPPDPAATRGVVTLLIEIRGAKSLTKLAARLSEIDGVTSVHAGDGNLTSD